MPSTTALPFVIYGTPRLSIHISPRSRWAGIPTHSTRADATAAVLSSCGALPIGYINPKLD
ncbi:MAG: hypothetical protein ACYYK0_01685 [Candidatus Eutrophobiaceae bacterium]